MKLKLLKVTFVGLVLAANCLVNTANAGLITERWEFKFLNLTGNGAYDSYFKYSSGDIYSFELSYNTDEHYYSETNLGSGTTTNRCDSSYTGAGGFCDSVSSSSLHYANVNLSESFDIFDFDAIQADGYSLSNVLNNEKSRLITDNNGGFDYLYESRGQRLELFSGTFGATELFLQPSDPQAPWERPRFILEFLSRETIDVGNPPVPTVPEPSTLAIFAIGMIGLVSRRFKKQS